MLPVIANYMKNIPKSIVYSAIEVVKQDNATIRSFADVNEDLFRDTYHALRDYKGTLRKIDTAVRSTALYKAGDMWFTNALEDIKTGKFYNKERENRLEQEAADAMMGDMEDFESGFEDTSSGGEKSSSAPTAGDKAVCKSIGDASAANAVAIGTAVAQTGEYIVKTNKRIADVQMLNQQKMIGVMETGFGIQAASIQRLHTSFETMTKTIGENQKLYFENMTKAMGEQNSMLKELLEMERARYSKEQEKEKKEKHNRYEDVVTAEGAVDLKAYGKAIFSNFRSELDNATMGLGSMLTEENLKQFTSNPLSFIPEFFVRGLMGPQLKKTMKKFDQTLSKTFGNFIATMNAEANRDDNGIMGFVGKILGLKAGLNEGSIDTKAYNKGGTQWTGKDSMSLQMVIPSYLANIESILSGNAARIFNYETGKFTTGHAIIKDRERAKKRNYESPFSDIKSEMDKMVDLFALTESQKKEYKKSQEKFFQTYYTQGKFDVYDKSNRHYDWVTGGEGMFNLFKAMMERIPTEVRMAVAPAILEQKQSARETMERVNQDPSHVWRYLETIGDLDAFVKRDKDGNKIGVKGLGNNLLLEKQEDEYGQNTFDYLRAIKETLENIRTINEEGFAFSMAGASAAPTPGGIVLPSGGRILGGRSGRNWKQINDQRRGKRKSTDQTRRRDMETERERRSIEDVARQIEKGKKKAFDLDEGFADTRLALDQYVLERSQRIDAAIHAANRDNFISELLYESGGRLDEFNKKLEARGHKPMTVEEHKKFLEKLPLHDQLVFAESVGEKFRVVSDSLANIAAKPASILTGIIERADKHIVDLFFSKEATARDEDGKPIYGFFGYLNHQLRQQFTNANNWINKKLADFREKYGEGEDSTWGAVNNLIKKHTGIDIREKYRGVRDSIFGDPETGEGGILSPVLLKMRESVEEILLTMKDSTVEAVKGIAQDVGITGGESTNSNIKSMSDEYKELLQQQLSGNYKDRAELLRRRDQLLPELGIIGTSGVELQAIQSKLPGLQSEIIEAEERLKALDKYGNALNTYTDFEVLDKRLSEVNARIDALYALDRDLNGDEYKEIGDLTRESEALSNQYIRRIFKEKYVKETAQPRYNSLIELLNSGSASSDELAELSRLVEFMNNPDANTSILNPAKPGMASGGKVPKTGLYVLSAGEQVIPNANPEEDAKKEAALIKTLQKRYPNFNFDGSYAEGTIENPDGNKPIVNLPEYTKSVLNTIGEATKAVGDAITGGHPELIDEYTQKAKAKISDQGGYAAAGALFGGAAGLFAGGPLLGAVIGASLNVARKSEKVNEWLFGKENVEEDDSGFISKETQKKMAKYLPDMKKYGIAGGLLGLIGPFGLLGGAALGAGVAMIKNNDNAREFLFGDSGVIDKNLQKKLKKMAPGAGAGAIAGIIGGMTMGFGLLPAAVIGAGMGMVATTDEFKNAVLGVPDKDGKRQGGLVQDMRNAIMSPFKSITAKLSGAFTRYLKEDIVSPVSRSFAPFSKMMALGMKNMFDSIKDIVSTTMGNVINPIGRYVSHGVQALLERTPIGRYTKKLAGYGVKGIASLFALPSKMIGKAGDRVREELIRYGNADFMTSAEQMDFMRQRGFEGDYETSGMHEVFANADSNTLKEYENQLKILQESNVDINKMLQEKRGALNTQIQSQKGITALERNNIMKALDAGDVEGALKYAQSLPIPGAQRQAIMDAIKANYKEMRSTKEFADLANQNKQQAYQALSERLGFNVTDSSIDKIRAQLRTDISSRESLEAEGVEDMPEMQKEMNSELELQTGWLKDNNDVLRQILNTLNRDALSPEVRAAHERSIQKMNEGYESGSQYVTARRNMINNRVTREFDKLSPDQKIKISAANLEVLSDDSDNLNTANRVDKLVRIATVNKIPYNEAELNAIIGLDNTAFDWAINLSQLGVHLSTPDITEIPISLQNGDRALTNARELLLQGIKFIHLVEDGVVPEYMQADRGTIEQMIDAHKYFPNASAETLYRLIKHGEVQKVINLKNSGLGEREALAMAGRGISGVFDSDSNRTGYGERREGISTRTKSGNKFRMGRAYDTYERGHNRFTQGITDKLSSFFGINRKQADRSGKLGSLFSDEAREAVEAQMRGELPVESHAFGGLASAGLNLLSKGEEVISAVKGSKAFDMAKTAWNGAKAVAGAFKSNRPAGGGAKSIGSAAGNTSTTEKRAGKAMVPQSTDYGPVQYVRSSDGSLTMANTKDNVEIQKKIAERDSIQTKILDTLTDMRNMMGKLAGGGEEGAPEGDSLFSKLLGLLGTVAGFLSPKKILELLGKLGKKGLTALGKLVPSWVSSGVHAIGEGLSHISGQVAEFASGVLNKAKGAVKGAWEGIKGAAHGAWEGVKGAAHNAWEGIKGAGNRALEMGKGALDWAKGKFGSAKDWVTGKAKAAAEWGFSKFSSAKSMMQQQAAKYAGNAAEWAKKAAGMSKETLEMLRAQIYGTLKNATKFIAERCPDAFKGGLQKFFDKILAKATMPKCLAKLAEKMGIKAGAAAVEVGAGATTFGIGAAIGVTAETAGWFMWGAYNADEIFSLKEGEVPSVAQRFLAGAAEAIVSMGYLWIVLDAKDVVDCGKEVWGADISSEKEKSVDSDLVNPNTTVADAKGMVFNKPSGIANAASERQKAVAEARSGRGKFYDMTDPRVAGIPFNKSGDTMTQTIGDSACGPAAFLNGASSLGRGKNALVTESQNALRYKEKDGGVSPQYFDNAAKRYGLSTNRVPVGQLDQEIGKGNKVILMGKDRNTKYGQGVYGDSNHYITITGRNKNGDFIAQDPEGGPNQRVSGSYLKSHSSMAVSMSRNGRGKWGRGAADPAQVWDYLRAAGYNEEATAGIMGRVQQEHNFNPEWAPVQKVMLDGDPAEVGGMGMFQWTWDRGEYIDTEEPEPDLEKGYQKFPDSRLGQYIGWTKQNNKPIEDAQSQLDYLIAKDLDAQSWTGHTFKPDEMNQLNRYAAADLWTKSYERGVPGSEHEYADELFTKYQNRPIDPNVKVATPTGGSSTDSKHGGGGGNFGGASASSPSGFSIGGINVTGGALGSLFKSFAGAATKVWGPALTQLFGNNPFDMAGVGGGGNGGTSGGAGASANMPSGDVAKANAWADTVINKKQDDVNPPYWYGRNGCTAFVNEYLKHSGAKEIDMWVPNAMDNAKKDGTWADAKEGGKPGDVALIETDGEWDEPDHVVIDDGNGGFYGNSSGQGQIVHDKYNDYFGADHIWGYIRRGSGNAQVQSGSASGDQAQRRADEAGPTSGGRGKHKLSPEEQEKMNRYRRLGGGLVSNSDDLHEAKYKAWSKQILNDAKKFGESQEENGMLQSQTAPRQTMFGRGTGDIATPDINIPDHGDKLDQMISLLQQVVQGIAVLAKTTLTNSNIPEQSKSDLKSILLGKSSDQSISDLFGGGDFTTIVKTLDAIVTR